MKYLLILLLLICSTAYAEDVVQYSGSTYLGCSSIGNTNVFLTNPNDYATIKEGYIYLPNGCSSLPQVAKKYLKISNGAVVEMSLAEKQAVDAAEAQAVIDAETARLGALDDKLTETQTITLPKVELAIDNISNLADAKVFLKRLCRYLAKQ